MDGHRSKEGKEGKVGGMGEECVRAKFARSKGLLNGKRRIQVVLMDEAQRTWHATIDTQFHLGSLREFIKNNDLKIHDECTFELIKHGKVPVFSVLIQRSKVVGKRKRNDHSSKNEDALKVDDNRRFTAKFTPYCITNYRLRVPAKYVRSNGLHNGKRRAQVVLIDEAQRAWHATFDNSQFHLASLHEFMKNNDLKVEDECTFELIEHGKVPVFSVLIHCCFVQHYCLGKD
ncbi:putative B3 domain-containing protein REM4 [Rutidosis leptorrhynchoides]|uniref:putative B3 domain-containing protein REM4 n=1 Tax=Rutidosis leptorrhynchoides TaxID=125765 RepID=UPI003A99B23C